MPAMTPTDSCAASEVVATLTDYARLVGAPVAHRHLRASPAGEGAAGLPDPG